MTNIVHLRNVMIRPVFILVTVIAVVAILLIITASSEIDPTRNMGAPIAHYSFNGDLNNEVNLRVGVTNYGGIFVPSPGGQSIRLTNGAYVDLGKPDEWDFTKPITVATKLLILNYTNLPAPILIKGIDVDPQNTPFDLSVLSDGRLRYSYEYGDGQDVIFTTSYKLELGKYYDIIVSRSESNRVIILINGNMVLDMQNPNFPSDTSDSNIFIGKKTGAGHDSIQAEIDVLKIYAQGFNESDLAYLEWFQQS